MRMHPLLKMVHWIYPSQRMEEAALSPLGMKIFLPPYWIFHAHWNPIKTYDDTNLIKTADIGQIVMVWEEADPAPEGVEYKHGLTPPMRDARRRRFRREPDLNPELVQQVEKDILKIISGGTVKSLHAEANGNRSVAQAPADKPDIAVETTGNGGEPEPERSDSEDSAEPEN